MIRATGLFPGHKLEYAVGFASDGAPGPLRNYPIAGSQVNLVAGLGAPMINGQQISQPIKSFGLYSPTQQYAGIGGVQFTEPLYVCCSDANTAYYSRNELAKFRFDFSQSTSLTVSYLGGQAFVISAVSTCRRFAIGAANTRFSTFAPPPGYTGSVAPGTGIPYDWKPSCRSTNRYGRTCSKRNLDQLWSVVHARALLYRFRYRLSLYPNRTRRKFRLQRCNVGRNPGLPDRRHLQSSHGTCSSGTPTTEYFNGQNAKFSVADATNIDLEEDHLRGGSALFTRPFGNGDDISFSADQAHHDSISYTDDATEGPAFYGLPPGASQNFTTEMLRGHFYVAPRVFVGLANYFIQYAATTPTTAVRRGTTRRAATLRRAWARRGNRTTIRRGDSRPVIRLTPAALAALVTGLAAGAEHHRRADVLHAEHQQRRDCTGDGRRCRPGRRSPCLAFDPGVVRCLR